MICKDCGNQVPDSWVFCPQCGNRLKAPEKRRVVDYITQELRNDICTSCGATFFENASFCAKCGNVRSQRGAQRRIPKCVRCEEPLLLSARFCIMCKLGYLPAEDGYVEIPSLPRCPNCDTFAEEDVAFCKKCGQKIPPAGQEQTELCLPVCPECQAPYEAGVARCAGCGAENIDTSKYPIINGDTLTCPACGESKMPPNRKVCWRCGMEWRSQPWHCYRCGKLNLYKTKTCFHCHAKQQ